MKTFGGVCEMVRYALLASLAIVWLTASGSLAAEDQAGVSESLTPETVSSGVDFSKQVYPILRRSCFECHGEDKQEGSLRLDHQEAVNDSGSVDPGDSANSELVRRLELPESDVERMPAIGKSLTPAEIAVLRAWIDAGAVWPDQVDELTHWAYVPPKSIPSPSVSNEPWLRNEIDRFVLQRLDQEGMNPSKQAPPEMLIRRLFLDLIGLPPSVEEVKKFCTDPSEKAYAELVDDLLLRPPFGERWARHWLDLARYADSHGFQRDDIRDNWAYRDWVIAAINADMPFDQFTIEQLAGDLIPDATESQKVATGFHRCAPTNVEAGSIPEETRTAQLIDRVNTTATIWLGSTLECAQCHDHKFDPFSIREYYQLLAFFNNTALEADRANANAPSSIRFIGPTMKLSDLAMDPLRAAIEEKIDLLSEQKRSREKELAADLGKWQSTFATGSSSLPQIHPLMLEGFESQGNTDSHQVLDDHSILLVGTDPPIKDTYVFRARFSQKDIRGFRLDALTDPSLPGSGPGRGDASRPNFVLNEFEVKVLTKAGAKQPLSFASASADFSQRNFDVAMAIDGDETTAWAIGPQFAKPHWATFVLGTPIDAAEGIEFEFTMKQNFGGARNIGRFCVSAITGDIDAKPIPAAVHKIVSKPLSDWSEGDRSRIIEYRQAADLATQAIDQQIVAAQRELNKRAPRETLVMVELPEPRMTNIFVRGDYKSPGEQVEPMTPEILHPLTHTPADRSTPNRLSLAKWLVDPANPLVARVTVNRWWAELFGRGIVETVEDFGLKGESPSHPELLDHLAIRFQQSGWSMKQILRYIVMSSTYQQDSATSPEQYAADDGNYFLARGPRFRMDAETIRDNALAVSGLIDFKQAGPPIRPFQPAGIWTKVGGVAYDYEVSPGGDQHRRGIYVVIKRGAPYPSFINFDASNRLTCSVKRSRTNTPLQALTLLNDPVYVTAAKALAAQAASDTTRSSSEIISEWFCRCTSREPSDKELSLLTELLEAQRLAAKGQADSAALLKDLELKSQVSPESYSAWYSIATVLMNLHETITKP
jgi:hypothetical protein